MFAFIFEIGIFVSFAVLILIALRALPRISNEVFTESHSRVRMHELMIMLERVDDILKVLFEKFLRRLKVLIMKLDNIVTKKISKFKNERTKEKTAFILPAEEAPLLPEKEFVPEEKPMVLENFQREDLPKKGRRGRPRKVQL